MGLALVISRQNRTGPSGDVQEDDHTMAVENEMKDETPEAKNSVYELEDDEDEGTEESES